MSSRELHWFSDHLPMFKGFKFYFDPLLGANRSKMLGFTPNTLPLWRRMQIWSRGCPECPAERVPCRPRSRRPGGRGSATARPPASCGGSPAGPRRCPAQTQAPAHKTTINITHNVKKIYLCHTFLRLNIENGEALAFRSTHKTMMRLHFLNSITHLTQTNISNISLRFLRRDIPWARRCPRTSSGSRRRRRPDTPTSRPTPAPSSPSWSRWTGTCRLKLVWKYK
mgnify:CR=1 FL=1